MLGVFKYPVSYQDVVRTHTPQISHQTNKIIRMNDWLPPKGYYESEKAEVSWLLACFSEQDATMYQTLQVPPTEHSHGRAQYKLLDCSIMDIADDIAYGVHDLEDAIHLRLITRAQLDTSEFRALLLNTELKPRVDALLNALFDEEIYHRKQAIGELVNFFITSIEPHVTHDDFENPLLKYNVMMSASAKQLLNHLMTFIYQQVIDSQEARTFEYGGQTVVLRLFEAIVSNPLSLLDKKNRLLFEKAPDDMLAWRVIADYIANMTDEYAYRLHERLFGFNTRTIFESL